MSIPTADIKPRTRSFLPQAFKVTTWDELEPYFKNLLDRELDTKEQLQSWLQDLSELEAVIGEDASWRQIHMTLDTTNKSYEDAFTFFVTEIEPRMKPYSFALNKKLMDSPFRQELDHTQYFPYLRNVDNSIKLYREENIGIQSELSVLAQQFGVISSKMTIEQDGKEYTLQQAARFLQNPDRTIREAVFRKIATRRLEDKDKLNNLFDNLLQRRQQVAVNAGFDNYRDYKFSELGRFDYTPEDCFRFHDAIREHILPLQAMLQEHRRKRLGLDVLRPWDTDAEPAGTSPLHPFKDGKDLSDKAVTVFTRLRPFFGECLTTMQGMQRLDLDSRVGKAPGGYNCPLAETGVPFIFMNAAGTSGDVITMMHEGGHAVHSFLSHDLPLSAFKEYPMEIAELASMSMELFTMEHWDIFYQNADELQRAKIDEMERVISVLPWIATIDKFQHWIYTHVGHTVAEREAAWQDILKEFSTNLVDYTGFEHYRASFWQKQLHLFEVPFYYIEYGIAQLGAIAMWRQYRNDPQAALDNYMNALSLGYTRTLKELYETAGIKFDFSNDYVAELGQFVKTSLEEMGLK